MPSRKLTAKELRDKQVASKTKKFMTAVEEFIKSKNGGVLSPAFSASMDMLSTYYEQYVMLSEEIKELPSLVCDSRYGKVVSPLVTARDKTAVRLESLLKQMGLTFKAAAGLNVIEPVKEESALEAFVKNKMESKK